MDSVDVITSAMVLAAGRGTRLHPLTAGRAKAVIPFLNRPLLDYTLDWLRRCGLEEVVINLHHCPDSVRRRYGGHAFGVRLRYSVEEKLLGTAGGVRAALDALGQRVLLVNGDVVTSMALGPLVDHHRRNRALATLALHSGGAALEHPAVLMGEGGEVAGFPEPPQAPPEHRVGGSVASGMPEEAGRKSAAHAAAHACFAGIHLVEREVFELVPPLRPCGIVDPVYRQLIAAGLPVHAVELAGPWYEVGTLPRYLQSQLCALRREDFPLAYEGYQRQTIGGFVTTTASIGRAGVEPPFMIADGARVADGAQLKGVIAGRNSCIGAGATVVDSVLLDGAWVGTAATLEGVVVLENAYVPPGTEVRDQAWSGSGPLRNGASVVPAASG